MSPTDQSVPTAANIVTDHLERISIIARVLAPLRSQQRKLVLAHVDRLLKAKHAAEVRAAKAAKPTE